MFKYIKIYLLVLLSIIIVTACGHEKVESQRINMPIEIDGSSEDWADYRQLFNEDWKTVYAIANDDTSISIMMQFRDDQLARKINTRGFTLWLNTEGDKTKQLGIHYEDRKLMDKMLNDMADGKNMPNREKRKSDFNKTVEFSGTFTLIDKEMNLLSENGQNGIYAEALYNQGSYCFEYKVTLDANEINPELFNFSLESDLKVGIEIAAVSDEFKEILKEKMGEKMKSGTRPSGGMSGGGMRGGGKRGGGRGGGGMGGPPSGGRDNNMKDTAAQEIWFSVELAK
jgi:uncharacterized membrane protein YgcG